MTCKDCIGYEYCNPQPKNPRKVEKWCDKFKNKADFVEVVRCEDCAFYDNGECNNPVWNNGEYEINVFKTSFCSYGERKDT